MAHSDITAAGANKQPDAAKNTSTSNTTTTTTTTTTTIISNPTLTPQPQTQKSLHRISLHPTLTPYRRRVYRTLLSVPAGRWTTYAAMASYLHSSPRAVGNAMRTNPFAPEVPCHRVLAADGSLGGYKGQWRVSEHRGSGSFCDEKRLRLEEEGVVFDEAGRATGGCFVEFGDWAGVRSR